MTKEIKDILAAYKEAKKYGRKTALATVVHVEGSSYRMPGARMLVEENGNITGAISGGCLEGDALRKALLAINQRQNKLVTYNTLDEDDIDFGVQLGCNGIVHILFEPIDLHQKNNPISFLELCIEQRTSSILITLFSLSDYYGPQPGTCFFFDGEKKVANVSDQQLAEESEKDAKMGLLNKASVLKQFKTEQLTGFVEYLEPIVSLNIIGAGNDALPLVDLAKVLGWQVTVIDGRATHANKQRFHTADEIYVGKPEAVLEQLQLDERSVFVLMTHNYNYDLSMLKELLSRNCPYIGTLGPKKRLQRMLSDLESKGVRFTEEQLSAIYGPIGLDIGAESSEEIALSVMAEIKAVLSKRNGGYLRERKEGIHSRLTVENTERKTNTLE